MNTPYSRVSAKYCGLRADHPAAPRAGSRENLFHFGRRRVASRRSMALIITLAILVLMTILVVAFLSTVSLDRQATANYGRSLQADSFALGGLDQVVAQLQAEVTDPNESILNVGTAPAGTMYSPKDYTNAVPARMSSLPTVVTYSGTNVYYGAPNLAAAGSLTTTASLNNRYVSLADWQEPQLTTTTTGFPVPQWILVTRNGSFPTTWNANLANHSADNGAFVMGRYAYVVYDTSGLIDINASGYPASASSLATNKGVASWTDLTVLPGITQSDVNNLIAFRNAASSSTYSAYATNWATNGFMSVAPGDTTFLSRQELIKYAQQSGNSDWTGALPYLTTFSREVNGPTFGPRINATNLWNNIAFPYFDNANNGNATNYNPNIFSPTVTTSFTNYYGGMTVPGEPLVKYRFPLQKLALLESIGTTYSYTDWQANVNNIQADIQRYFGLDVAADSVQGHRHFLYPTSSTQFLHKQGTSGVGGIMSLTDVAAQNREPDFFELLQAGVLQGSLGVQNFVYTTTSSGRTDIVISGATPLTYNNFGGTVSDLDKSVTFHLLRIGANIIDQWHADNFPTTITGTFGSPPATADVYGIADLPYISTLYVLVYNQMANMGTGSATGPSIYFCPQLWNPHMYSANSSDSPTTFRIEADPDNNSSGGLNRGDAFECALVAPGVVGGSDFSYNAPVGTFTSGGNGTAGSLAAFSHPIVFTAAATDYREPAAITTAFSSNNASGVWAPVSPTIGALQVDVPLPQPTTLGQTPNSAVISTNATAAALPALMPPVPTTLDWAQATNTANYGAFGTSGKPIYMMNLRYNVVLPLEYQNPHDSQFYPYGSFVGLARNTNIETGFCNTIPPQVIQTNIVSTVGAGPLGFAQFWTKSDPRTFRFGPEERDSANLAGSALPAGSGASPFQSLNPTNTALAVTLANKNNNDSPFYGGGGGQPSPYRNDMWAENDITQYGYLIPTADNRCTYPDPDQVTRFGDYRYAYNSTTTYATPFLRGKNTYRPIVLHRPFQNVGELGYAFRDTPWRTLDFSSTNSADAGLLDLFTVSAAGVSVAQGNGQQNLLVAGRVNPNSPYPQVLGAIMSGTPTNAFLSTTPLSASAALTIATNIVTASTGTPFLNRADFVSHFLGNTATSTAAAPLYLKSEREAIVRALAESANTRTWNFLVDIVAQSGTYPSTAAASAHPLDSFVVGGERHYWLHVAIDRYTGQVVDRQLETVSQ